MRPDEKFDFVDFLGVGVVCFVIAGALACGAVAIAPVIWNLGITIYYMF